MEWKCKLCSENFRSLNVIQATRQQEVINSFLQHLSKRHQNQVTDINSKAQMIAIVGVTYAVARELVQFNDEEAKKAFREVEEKLLELLGMAHLKLVPKTSGGLTNDSFDDTLKENSDTANT